MATVNELEQLHGELNVADPAPPALDLPVGEVTAGELALGTRLHGADRAQVVGVEGPAPHPFPGRCEEGRSQLAVTGDGSRLEERLELPGVGPALPIRQVGLE